MKRLPPLNALRAFHAAAQKGSFTLAGEALHVTQGAISRQVKLLEESLAQPLFFRAHQSIELTEAGRMLAQTLEGVFQQIGETVDRITNDQRRKQISINVPPTFVTRWLAPRLSEFCRLHPYVDFQITTDWVKSLRDSHSHDCLVIFDTSPWPKSDAERLMLEKHVMVAHPSLWKHELPPTLQGQTLLHILHGDQRLPVWERWMALHGLNHLDPKPGLAFSTLDQAIHAAISGTGVAIVDEAMIRPELAAGTLRKLSDRSMDGPYGYWFMNVARDDEHRATVSLFQDWLRRIAGESQPQSNAPDTPA
jgi:LysR family glycine cleavage system transcriptional activator